MSNPLARARLARLRPAHSTIEDVITPPYPTCFQRRPGPVWLGCVLACILASPAGAQQADSALAESCPAGRISNIFVDNKSIFDVEQLESMGALRPLYELANRLHIRTHDGFILRELLFEVGDCFDPFLVEESGRLLRAYGFFAQADVFAVAQPDGSQHVVVDTQDEWTTKVDFGPSFEDGFQIEVLDITEENLLGRGIVASAFYRARRERRDLGLRFEQPRLFGSRTDARVAVGRTRDGSFLNQSVAYPFVGEIGHFAARQAFRRRDELFPYSVGAEDLGFSHVLLPYQDERMEISVATRVGQPGNLTLFGVGLSRESIDFGSPEIARDSDFGNPEPAPEGTDEILTAQTRPSGITRVNLFVGQRNLRFIRVRGLDALDGDRDVPLGTDLGLTLGRSIGLLDETGLASPSDLFTRLRLFGGVAPGSSFFFLNLSAEGRKVFAGGVNEEGWRDVIGEADVYAYLRGRLLPGQTLLLRASASGGWSMDSPFQLTLGGRDALRGLREEDYPGGRRILLTLEDRIFFGGWPAPQLMDAGLTLFADAGRAWAGEVPYGEDVGWKGSVGIGLRFGFPAGTRGVGRLDLAWPLGAASGRGPVFRITLYELLGLNGGFPDAQVHRSRRVTVGPDYFGNGGP